ncbi:MAG: hypothetical protein FJX77_16850, partial [Armatimonadetes bacterium]|nr:hypothetical protein [Armatimonadota bacterium]
GGVQRGEGETQLRIELPAARKPGSSEVVLQLNPSLATVMLDALPYLVEYPYGCLEQTTSRLLPGVVTARTLKLLGHDLEALGRRARELAANRPADPLQAYGAGPYSFPAGPLGRTPDPERRPDLNHLRAHSLVPRFSSSTLSRIVAEGLERITRYQNSTGGWGWWPAERDDPFMTAYVLYGLETAREAGTPVPTRTLDLARVYLSDWLSKDPDLDQVAYISRVLAMGPNYLHSQVLRDGAQRAFARRDRLSVYGQALLATAFHLLKQREPAEILLRNLENNLRVDPVHGLTFWEPRNRYFYHALWHQNQTETNAAILEAFVRIQPDSEHLPRLARWLVQSRHGHHWRTTRETAMAVYALAEYLGATGELTPEYTVTVALGDRIRRSYRVTAENALFFEGRFVVPDELLGTGAQTLTITKEGPGALYYTAFTRYFSLEEPIRAAGHELTITRRYFRLVRDTTPLSPTPRRDPDAPNPYLLRDYERLASREDWLPGYYPSGEVRYRRVPLQPSESLESGTLLEVVLEVDSPYDQT